ncbi:hypothetical protein N781_16275 [Pontibacillus halophilus JSM 076056 = DSM 19796]|uniref:Aldehyde dehydrogenase domain-containing protein n=1 Tax=Pontibacillus halophilus JSM 076056 = DSM 19796 TaxID=1385510 RepID=A0A0A5GGX3_9BACI|nr:aldehyde dehydrogenase family protein [Pontibacillus halophilus]KGX92481.1 hypothetical protein N781_16275 [Pontibacillus halophilus JSM 076056 = DSM 19796]
MSVTKEMMSVTEQATKAKKLSKRLSVLSTSEKDRLLNDIADLLDSESETILRGNDRDIGEARYSFIDHLPIDQMTLRKEAISVMADRFRRVAKMDDPTWKRGKEWDLERHHVEQLQVPVGVIALIGEQRPRVTVDAIALSIKTGNALLIGGLQSIRYTNGAIVELVQKALQKNGLPSEAVQLLDEGNRSTTQQLLASEDVIDLVIPGEGSVVEGVHGSTFPVLNTPKAHRHVYIDGDADSEKALHLLFESVANRTVDETAIDTLVLHKRWLTENKEALHKSVVENGINIQADYAASQIMPNLVGRHDSNQPTLRIVVVQSVNEAMAYMEVHGAKHTEGIVTENKATAEKFKKLMDATAIYVNASPLPGNELTKDVTLGLHTEKSPQRGPISVTSLTTLKYIVTAK